MSNKIVELMQVPQSGHDLAWLKKSLQAAVELELSTLPPYLCGLWSIQSDPSGVTTGLILGVVLEEMIHLGIVCNLLTSLGKTPEIVSGYIREITYPGGLPGGVRPGLTVFLSGLTTDYVKNVYMQIEMPEKPLTLAAETYPTIGAFYDAISAAFVSLNPKLSITNQLTTTLNSLNMSVNVISTVAEAVAGITEIKEQGEGTSTSTTDSPYTPDFGNGPELSHYYKFSEVYYGKTLIQANGQWVYQGTPVPFPATYPMAPIPAGGYKNPPPAASQALTAFNAIFSQVLNGLETAWATGSNSGLQDAINIMFNLQQAAQTLFGIELPDGSGVYGPDFVIQQ